MAIPASASGAAHAEDLALHGPQARGLELEPDDEQHQHDAELREVHRRLDVGDEFQPPRADRTARGEVPEHGAEAQPLGDRHAYDGRGQVDHHVERQAVLAHRPMPSTSWAMRWR
jgi:hypothetical protein